MIIRPATRDDVPTLVDLIGDLATYEREPDAVEVDEQLLTDALFAESPVVFANVADDDGDVLGMTVYFRNFSTWTGRLGIYLEDFYVRPEARGQGVGHRPAGRPGRRGPGQRLLPDRLVGARLERDRPSTSTARPGPGR